jgi:uncharacterized heparinase superfamily protein
VSWLLGPDAWDRVERRGAARRERRSVAFPAGGRYILRTADAHLVVCADEVGTAGLGNHKHNDILSFELSVDGVAMVVDPGVATYTSDRADRDEWRSTRSHNTVVVDGAEQNDLDGWFSMRQRAEVSVLRFDDRDLVVEAEHTGFSNVGVVHRRRLELGREPFSLVVTDTLEGSGAHVAVSYLHFAPGTTLASEPAGYAAANDGVALVVRPVGDVQARLADARFAPRYGTWVGAPVLELEVSFADRVQLGYRIERRGAR